MITGGDAVDDEIIGVLGCDESKDVHVDVHVFVLVLVAVRVRVLLAVCANAGVLLLSTPC